GDAIVEGEAAPDDDAALVASIGVGQERDWVVVSLDVEEERRDVIDGAPIERRRHRTLRLLDDVNDADDHRRAPRPLGAPRRRVNHAAVLAYPAEPALAGVTLGDRVGGHEP